MGWNFSLKDANIVAYLTSTKDKYPPRIRTNQLEWFLSGMQRAAERHDKRVFISSFPEWTNQIGAEASRAEELLRIKARHWSEGIKTEKSDLGDDLGATGQLTADIRETFLKEKREFLPSTMLIEVLNGLKQLFSDYYFFGLAIGRLENEFRAFTDHIAYHSAGQALFLMPDEMHEGQDINFLDPFPAITSLAEQAAKTPGCSFWSRSENFAFAPLRKADELYYALLKASYEKTLSSELVLIE